MARCARGIRHDPLNRRPLTPNVNFLLKRQFGLDEAQPHFPAEDQTLHDDGHLLHDRDDERVAILTGPRRGLALSRATICSTSVVSETRTCPSSTCRLEMAIVSSTRGITVSPGGISSAMASLLRKQMERQRTTQVQG